MIKSFIKLVFLLIIVAVLAFGYLGFVPGLSSLFGSDKPKDLGITYTDEDIASINQVLGLTYENSKVGVTFAVSGEQVISGSFTQEQITALTNHHSGLWKYYPVSDVQMKFNADGTAEVSGFLRIDRIRGYADATGIKSEDIDNILKKIDWITGNPPFYLKGTAKIVKGELSGKIETLQIGKLSVPLHKFLPNNSVITNFAVNRINISGIKPVAASFDDGVLHFTGTIPSTIQFAK